MLDFENLSKAASRKERAKAKRRAQALGTTEHDALLALLSKAAGMTPLVEMRPMRPPARCPA